MVENPIVNRVSFEGNGAINDDTLTKESELRPRQVYTRARVQDDVERFIEIYRQSGYFAARIELDTRGEITALPIDFNKTLNVVLHAGACVNLARAQFGFFRQRVIINGAIAFK